MLIKNIKSKKEMLKQVQHDVAAVIAGLTRNPFKRTLKVLLFAAFLGFTSCGDWLDVVPEGMPTMNTVFNSRVEALKYLSTCYSYMPNHADPRQNPEILGCDEVWTHVNSLIGGILNGYNIAIGRQSSNNPLLGCWDRMYRGLRDCNIFLENVGSVHDLPEGECEKWIAEVKVLKAYYHFCLVQMYGPVPLVRENIPIHEDISKMNVARDPADDCFAYIVELLDEALEALEGYALPMTIVNVADELGRITKPIAYALKAKVLTVAASPLFNGNEQQAPLRNRDQTPLFNTTPVPEKWVKAMEACRDAIEICRAADIELFYYPNTGATKYTDTIATQLSLRNAFTQRWNCEIIWGNVVSLVSGATGLQYWSTPLFEGARNEARKDLGAPIKIANMFYTDHGVPLEEDNIRDFSKIYDFREATEDERLYVKEGSTTVDMHFDREPRFYAWLGFDCGVWHGQGRNDENDRTKPLFTMDLKFGTTESWIWHTGYLIKKYTPYTNVSTAAGASGYSMTPFPWPVMRLSDLFLLYAEAINEVEGPNGENSVELFYYINEVRKRAGLKGVKESWNAYGKTQKYNTPAGMRQIIQQERMIELCFEGQRFWDIRRWKIAPELYRTPIQCWNYKGETNAEFYNILFLFQQKFNTRDYFWPILNDEIYANPNLVQNLDW